MRYYNEDGDLMENPDLSDKLLCEMEPDDEGARMMVKEIAGDAKEKRDNTLAILSARKSLGDTDYIAAKAMDALLSAESLSDILKALSEFREKYADKITERESAREKVREMEEAGASLGDLMAPFGGE